MGGKEGGKGWERCLLRLLLGAEPPLVCCRSADASFHFTSSSQLVAFSGGPTSIILFPAHVRA